MLSGGISSHDERKGCNAWPLFLFSRADSPAFQVDEPQQKYAERNQRQREEHRSTMAVNGGIDHLRPDVHAKLSDDKDAKTIAQ